MPSALSWTRHTTSLFQNWVPKTFTKKSQTSSGCATAAGAVHSPSVDCPRATRATRDEEPRRRAASKQLASGAGRRKEPSDPSFSAPPRWFIPLSVAFHAGCLHPSIVNKHLARSVTARRVCVGVDSSRADVHGVHPRAGSRWSVRLETRGETRGRPPERRICWRSRPAPGSRRGPRWWMRSERNSPPRPDRPPEWRRLVESAAGRTKRSSDRIPSGAAPSVSRGPPPTRPSGASRGRTSRPRRATRRRRPRLGTPID